MCKLALTSLSGLGLMLRTIQAFIYMIGYVVNLVFIHYQVVINNYSEYSINSEYTTIL